MKFYSGCTVHDIVLHSLGLLLRLWSATNILKPHNHADASVKTLNLHTLVSTNNAQIITCLQAYEVTRCKLLQSFNIKT